MDFLRTQMIYKQLKQNGIQDEKIIKAFYIVPRHYFVNPIYQLYAYDEDPVPIGLKQSISDPYITAYMLELLTLEKSDKVLEIGSGTGYVTAILSYLVSEVYGVESLEELYLNSKKILKYLNRTNTEMVLGNGLLGYHKNAPYNKIFVSCATPSIPKALVEQLELFGKMIIPIGDTFSQHLHLITHTVDGITDKVICECNFCVMTFDSSH